MHRHGVAFSVLDMSAVAAVLPVQALFPVRMQVVTSIQSCDPAIDEELEKLLAGRRPRHDLKQYCMLPGRLFSAAPAALGFVVSLSLARAHRFMFTNVLTYPECWLHRFLGFCSGL
jgi:hypothetical protein